MKKGSRGSLLVCSEADRSVAAATTETAATTAAAFATATTVAATTATTTAATAAVGATETAATAAAFTTAAAVTTATCTGRTWLHGASFVHHQATTTQRCAVHAFDCGLCFGIAAHFHKTKTFGTTGIALHHDFGASHSTELSKRLLKIAVAYRVRQVADVQFIAHERDSLKHKNKAMESRTETDRSPNMPCEYLSIYTARAIMEHKSSKKPSVYL